MSDLMWATTKDSTSVHFGFGHRCHKNGRMFDLEHIRNYNAISGCKEIDKYVKMIKERGKIRIWDQDLIVECSLQYKNCLLN